MRKIIISILALLLWLTLPISAWTADEVSFAQDTNLIVGDYILVVSAGGVVDQMVTSGNNVTFTLSANSTLTIRSDDKKVLNNNLGINLVCADSYSYLSVSGNSLGSSLVVTVSGVDCSEVLGGGGAAGGAAPVSVTPSMPTTATGEVTATASVGGKTTLTTDEGTIATVELPANAVSVSTVVKIKTEAKETVTGFRPIPSDRSVVGIYIYDYTATADGATVSNFDKTITLTFSYTDAQVSGLNESNLGVFYWDESTSQWTILTTAVDEVNNTLTVVTNHFTYFAILGTAAAAGEDGEEVTINDGNLIRNPQAEGLAQFDVYIVKLVGSKKFKRLILSPHVFESYEHLKWGDIKDVSQSIMDEYPASALVRAEGDNRVYQLTPSGDSGTKQWLNMTSAEFETAGYDWDTIYVINTVDRDAYTTGAEITQ
jgi:hypothetical protein